MMRRTIGVIGGMGPQATVDFLQKIIAATPVSCEQDHLTTLTHIVPSIPNRHHSIAGTGPSAEGPIVEVAMGLERAGAHFLVMPSHTPHAYTASIRDNVSIPFVSMVEITCDELEREYRSGRTIGLLAAEGCLAAGLYQNHLGERGFSVLTLEAEELSTFMHAVFAIKHNQSVADAGAEITELAHRLGTRGADVIVAACTEVPLAIDALPAGLPLVDPTALLARESVHRALFNLS